MQTSLLDTRRCSFCEERDTDTLLVVTFSGIDGLLLLDHVVSACQCLSVLVKIVKIVSL
jgi:hypothetical protein